MSALTSITKNSGTISNILINIGILLREEDGIILSENGGRLLREGSMLSSITKNSGTLTNISKN